MLSENELTNSVKIGVEAGTIPEKAIPVFRQAVEQNATNKDDVNANIGVCNLDCFKASLDDTLTNMDVEDEHKVPILTKVADSIQAKQAATQMAANDAKKADPEAKKKAEAAAREA